MNNNSIISTLQSKAISFLQNYFIIINNVAIYLKEIEVYYFKKGELEDTSVHCNEMQANRKYKLYVHRAGKKASNKYRGANYAGVDFVLSDEADCYYTYLIRAIAFEDGDVIVGPNNVLKAILEKTGLSMQELEEASCEVVSYNQNNFDVCLSTRINLGKNTDDEHKNLDLRAVIVDESFTKTKYKQKEKLFTNLLISKFQKGEISKDTAIEECKSKLGYTPSIIKNL